MCLAAIARQRGRRVARAPSATSRSRANGGDSSTAIVLRRAVDRAGLTNQSGVQMATGRGARSRARRRSDPKSCPGSGQRKRPACRMAGGTGVERHAAAAACDGKGTRVEGPCRNSLRGPDCLQAEPDRPAKLIRTPARPADAAPGAADSLPFLPKKLPEAHPASLPRTAFRAVSRLPSCSTRGL